MGLKNLAFRILERIHPEGFIKITFTDIYTGEQEVKVYKNTITADCKDMIADRLVGGSNDCDITYGAVGTGAFPADPGASTDLVTENDRVILAARTSSGGVVSLTAFFGASDANATWTEFAWFGQGATSSADSGIMINHVAVSETKTSSKTATVDGTITLS